MNNEDRITFNLKGEVFFRLIFHTGAKVKESVEKGPLIEDATGLLEWVSSDRAVIKIMNLNDAQSKKENLVEIVSKWIEV